jgi:prepilin-type N-terminal cleavage/methylation domain-containing protein
MKKAFTLLETVIVLIIVGILAVVLVESYTTISGIAFRIQQEKNLTEESLLLTQMMQSITDTAKIDYDKYDSSLSESQGFTDILYLTGEQRSGTSITWSGDCLALEGEFADSDCQLVLSQNGKDTPLLATNGKIIVSQVLFRIIPFDSEERYYNLPAYKGQTLVNEVAKPAFWLFLHLYSPYYQPIGKNNIHQPLQLFFNLNG